MKAIFPCYQIWDVDNQQCRNARQWCKLHSKSADYIRVRELRDDITIDNIALVLERWEKR